MKRILAWLLIAVMVVSCVAFAACGGGGGGGATEETHATTTTPSGGGQPTGEEDSNGNGGGGDDLEDIVGQAAAIDSVNYVMRITAPGTPTVTTEVWMKGDDKLRTEMTQQGQTMVYLVDYDTGVAYMYMPDQNMAYQIDISQVSQPDYGEVQDIPDYNPTIVGTETVDGKVCLVVEYSYAGATVKGWIWKEHGFPVKMEMTTAQGKTTIEYLDIDFSNIPDSMFELPAGVQILQMPSS